MTKYFTECLGADFEPVLIIVFVFLYLSFDWQLEFNKRIEATLATTL